MEPAITVKFNPSKEDKIVSLLIFEWEDRGFLGRKVKESDPEDSTLYFCKEDTVKAGLCNRTDIGRFLTKPNTEKDSKRSIFTEAVVLKDAKPIRYKIDRTGYYCIQAYGFTAKKFEAIVTFRNSYGELAAAQIPKLTFYGMLSIVYALMGMLWMFFYWLHRTDICM